MAIPLAIVLMHRPVWLAGAVTACLFAPAPLLGVQIGSIADRYPRRSLLSQPPVLIHEYERVA